MPRSRESYTQLLRNFPDSDKINAVSEGAEVLYLRILAVCDDADHYFGDAGWIANKLFTSRLVRGEVTIPDIELRIRELEKVGLVRRYETQDRTYLEVIDRFKIRRKDVHPDIIFPGPQTEPERNGHALLNGSKTDPKRTRSESVTPEHVALDQTRLDQIRLETTVGGTEGVGGIFKNVTKTQLGDSKVLLGWHRTLVRHQRLDPSEATLRNFFGAAERALEVGKKSPGGLFRRIVETKDWKLLSDAQLDRAVVRLKKLQREGAL